MDSPKSNPISPSGVLSNLSIIFCSTDDTICSLYHKHFREIPRTSIQKQDPTNGDGCLVLPLPSSFGLFSPNSFLNDIITFKNISALWFLTHTHSRKIGPDLPQEIANHITNKYLGEQQVGSAFILKNSSKSTNFKHIAVVALFRALTCRGDELAWLDPRHVPTDFTYTAMRGVILRILQHNSVSKTNQIKRIFFPDFWRVIIFFFWFFSFFFR